MEGDKKENRHIEHQLVIFRIGEEEFGVGINEIREIIKEGEFTKIPNTEEYLKGIMSLRGGIIVVIDLAKKLGLQIKEKDKNSRIIVVEIEKSTIGMLVDSCNEVLNISSENIQEAPEIITKKIHHDYLEGVGILNGRLIILLNLQKILGESELEKVREIHNDANNSEKNAKEENHGGPTEIKAEAEKEAPA